MRGITILEIVELGYNYIVLKAKDEDIKPRLRYTVPLVVPMVQGLEPFEFTVSGVVSEVNWDKKYGICTFKLVNLELEELYKIDSWDVYDEIVAWWQEQREPVIGKDENTITIYNTDKYTKYKKIKQKIDLLRLFSSRRR